MKEFEETFTLPFELTNGNDGRGSKWFSSAKLRKKFEREIRARGLCRVPFPFPVKIEVIRVMGKNQREWDSSSVLRGNWKEIEDALVACGWFTDDSPKFITSTLGRQDGSRRGAGPFIEIKITQDGRPFRLNDETEAMNLK